jgi:hypothetical protein
MRQTLGDGTADLLKLSQSFRLSLEKITKATARSFFNESKKSINSWEHTVYKLLSKRVSSAIVKGRRQRPDDNPLPHYIPDSLSKSKVKLRDSLHTSSTLHYTEAGNASISLSASVGIVGGVELPSAKYTNMPAPSRKDGSTASWAGWHDKVMRPTQDGWNEFTASSRLSSNIGISNLGTTRLKSVYDIMDEILSNRKSLPTRRL